ncbi:MULTISPECIES: patatin-like phospholipase family protein [Sphingobacterium]|uniref:patatin-like phospholipase family protein n=1 Tax=Sphingobacterium TaxID=28453 RepID=UPI002244D93D|nr:MULTISPECIES: patatin-like phospholipase family protein [Sphingobacterium]MCW8313330.1 patatin-like phospholipase family protein [Sphingobacterium sp. InxBP1]
MKNILALDGGGIRGIIPAMVLVALEEKLQKSTMNPNARIASYFDFIAGTSSGGILTSILLFPDENNPSQPKFSARDALNLFVNHGTEIFNASKWRHFLSSLGLVSELYSSAPLANVLDKYFQNARLSQLIKPCIITAYNIELRKNHFFRQQKAITHGEARDFYLKDVCKATSAAPTFFPVAEIYSVSKTRYPLIDGGVFAQNPSICGLLEVLKAFNSTQINDMFMVSLGTGMSKTAYNYEHFKKKLAIQIGPALVDIMTSASSESTEYFIRQLFHSNGKSQNYIRLEPANLSSINPSLDAASANNIQKLISLSDRLISEHEGTLDYIVAHLLKEKNQNKKKNPWSKLMDKF